MRGAVLHAPRRLGQPPPKDLDKVMTPQEASAMAARLTTLDDALAMWRFTAHSYAFAEKTAYMAEIWSRVQGNPGLRSWLEETEDGRVWLKGLEETAKVFRQVTQPKLFQSLGVLRGELEVNVLPKKFGVGVKARLPKYVHHGRALSYTDVVPNPGVRVIDMGDFSKTPLSDDVEGVRKAKADLRHLAPAELGAVWVVLIVIFSAAIVAYWSIIGTIKLFERDLPAVPDIQPVPPTPPGMDPSEWAKKWMDTQLELAKARAAVRLDLEKSKEEGFWQGLRTTIQWVIGGAIALAVIGVGVHFLTKD